MLLADVAEEYRGILWWAVGIIVLMIVIAAPVIFWLRKRLAPGEETRGPGFTLADLREMHKKGQMSDAEFERAKSKLLGELGHKQQGKP
jgi:putative oligomerization/nucleic acid binding protein